MQYVPKVSPVQSSPVQSSPIQSTDYRLPMKTMVQVSCTMAFDVYRILPPSGYHVLTCTWAIIYFLRLCPQKYIIGLSLVQYKSHALQTLLLAYDLSCLLMHFSFLTYTDFLRLQNYQLIIEYSPAPEEDGNDNCMAQDTLNITLDRVRHFNLLFKLSSNLLPSLILD